MRKYQILAVLSSVTLILDQVTKWLVVRDFHLGESIPIIPGFFSLTYIRNTGAAFGLLAQMDSSYRVPFFLIVPVIALVAIGYIFRKIPPKDVKLSVALSLVVGGAVGNLIDRIVYGYVVDFLDFHWKYTYHFPAFNIADSAICIGVGILMLDLLQNPQASEKQSADQDAVKDNANASSTR